MLATKKRSVNNRGRKDSKKAKYDKIMSDFVTFSEEFLKIIDNHGNSIPFVLNPEQKDFYINMSKFTIISKSRQLGLSTVSIALMLFNAIKYENTNYLLVSLNKKQVTDLFGRLKAMNDSLPREKFPYFPDAQRDNRDELVLSNGSKITVSVPDENAGRGSTYRMILLSEYAHFEIDQTKILTSVTQGLAKTDNSRLIIESTSNGISNYYYELYDNSSKGKTNYKPFFYGWATSKAHRTQFHSEIKEAVTWFMLNNKSRRLSKDDVTEEESRLLEIGATLELLMWRRYKLSSMPLQDFRQEFPSNYMESFVSSGRSVFDQAKIVERLNYIPQPIEADVLRRNLPESLYKWIGKGLNVYKLPLSGHRYFGGSDIASGSGGSGDSSTLSLINVDGEEVLSFNSNKISVYDMAELLDLIGKFYNYAFLAIERNGYGLPCIERLRNDYQYMNLYKHKTFDSKGQRKLVLGWNNTSSTKNLMISTLKEHFEKGWILVNDKDTLQQMSMFIEDDKGKTGNKSGQNLHDDLVISLGLSIIAITANKQYV